MASQTVADLVTAALHSVGVRRIYGVVGDSLNGITESLRKRGDIDWIHVRHEEAAAFAAGAEAHLTGAAGGLRGKLRAGQPASDQRAVRLPSRARAGAGDRRAYPQSAEIGGGYFQETHPEILFRECSHYCELVSNPEQLPARAGNRDAGGDRPSRRGCGGHSRRRRAARRHRRALAAAGLDPSGRRGACRPSGDLAELAALLNAQQPRDAVLRPRLRRRP